MSILRTIIRRGPLPSGRESKRRNTIRFAVAKTTCRYLPPLVARRISRSVYPRQSGIRDARLFTVRAQTGSFLAGTTEDKLAHSFSLVGYNDWRLWAIAMVLCRPGDRIIEVGANIGTETVGFSDIVGPSGRVIAFEPVPASIKWLNATLAMSRAQNVDVFPFAVGAEDGVVQLEVPSGSPSEAHISEDSSVTQGLLNVNCIALDSVSELLGDLRLLSIDVEGSELMVLRGAQKIIGKCAPGIVLEANPRALRALGTSSGELYELLRTLGYITRVVGRFGLTRVESTEFHGYQNWFSTFDNSQLRAVDRMLRLCAALPCIPRLHPLTRPRFR